jgi:hypothetical protein
MPRILQKINFISASVLIIFLMQTGKGTGQDLTPVDDRFRSLSQNSVTSLESFHNAIWIGPGLNAFYEWTGEIFVPETADSVFSGDGRVYSLQAGTGRVLAGIGKSSAATGEPVQTAVGYYISDSNGEYWDFIPFPLDERPPDECDGQLANTGPPCDIEFQYGSHTYIRTPIVVPQLSPPFEVDFRDETLLSVNWASGLLRSRDNGASWERIILPPSSKKELNPDGEYEWISQTTDGEAINRYDPRFDNNLLGFGLMIDSNGTVWTGTAGGINISDNALSAPVSEISWKRVAFDPDRPDGLLANWIVTIREQPETSRIWMTNWQTDPLNRDVNGLVYTDDHGETFHHFLNGVRVNDIGFKDDVIFAAADDGLYISRDDGVNWERHRRIDSPNTFIPEGTRFYAITATDEYLYAGTGAGIAYTSDFGERWNILRVNMPLRGGNIYQPDAPDTETYSYPNPFSPRQHRYTRIKFETDRADNVQVTIYDFAMRTVRNLEARTSGSGSFEIAWDGRDRDGRTIANGTYFYRISKTSGVSDGKILVID